MRAFKIILLFLSSFLLYTNVYAESNLVIESVRTTEKSSTMVVSDLSYVDMTITSKMEFHTLNDFVTYEIEIKNNSEKTYTLEKIINHLNTNYLSVESDDIGAIISKEEKKTIHIKVKYVEELINVESVVPNDSSLTLNFIDTTVIENPFTFDRFILLLIQIIMAIGIIGFSIIYFKKPIKLLLLLLLIPIYVFAQEMININFNFSQVSVYGRFLSYHIQLDDGSGNVNDYTRTYGEKVGDLPVPEKEGYTFEGWVDQNDRAVDRETVVEEDLDLTATYGLVHYTITYNLNGGELVLPNPTSYTVEDEFTLYNPIKTGYTFGGWIAEGSSTLQTEFTIYPGTTGNKTFTAFYSPNPSTVYTVIHKQMNLEGVYEEYERETLHGATESRVSPQPQEYPGFKIPELQTITIAGDGSSTVTYLYERNKYTFQVHNREDIESATEDGLYYYGTRVNVTAKIKLGYTLLWNDGSELYERSFLLENDTILTPSYTPLDNTPYTVIHKQMNLDGTTYSLKDTVTFYGTTDTTVTPLPNDYEGFTSPSAQELIITGDGEARVTYLYTRNQYSLMIEDEEYVETTTPSGEYYYGTTITLSAVNRNGYQFIQWSNEETDNPYTFTIVEDITIGPIYRQKVIVTFDNGGGNNLSFSSKELFVGDEYGEFPTINRDGYELMGWGLLPSEYQAVEYIHFNGAQYLDTQLIPIDHTLEIKFDMETYTNNERLFGTDMGQYYYNFTSGDSKYYYATSGNQYSFGSYQEGIHTLIYNGENHAVIFDDVMIGYDEDITSNESLYIGKRERSNLNGKVYFVKIIDRLNSRIVRNLIPCYKKSNGEIGMYDLINGVFYTNQGSNEFTKGDDYYYTEKITSTTLVTNSENHTLYPIWRKQTKVTFRAEGGEIPNGSSWIHSNNSVYKYLDEFEYGVLPVPTKNGYVFRGWGRSILPPEYHQVEYITTTGNQYIDTGISTTTTDTHEYILEFRPNNSNGWTGVNGSMQLNISGTSSTKNKYRVSYDGTTGVEQIFIQDEFVSSSNWNVGAWIGVIYIGKLSNHTGDGIKGDIFSFKVFDNNILVRDYVPCYRVSDNVIGMYDLVNDEFYTNKGSGSFSMGNDVEYFEAISSSTLPYKIDHYLTALWE